MANITPAVSYFPSPGDPKAIVAKWTPMANGDVALPIDITDFADRSVQINGTFGAGGNVIVEGSNDGVTFNTLHDPLGVALGTITAATLVHILEMCAQMRVRVSAGDGTTSLTATMFSRRTFR
jgi:hypothetical protein